MARSIDIGLDLRVVGVDLGLRSAYAHAMRRVAVLLFVLACAPVATADAANLGVRDARAAISRYENRGQFEFTIGRCERRSAIRVRCEVLYATDGPEVFTAWDHAVLRPNGTIRVLG